MTSKARSTKLDARNKLLQRRAPPFELWAFGLDSSFVLRASRRLRALRASVVAKRNQLPMKARENPFAVDRVLKVRYRFQVNGWAEFLDRLAASRCRGAIVGPEGSGKTTLLEDLRPRLTQRGYQTVWIRLARGERTSLRSLL